MSASESACGTVVCDGSYSAIVRVVVVPILCNEKASPLTDYPSQIFPCQPFAGIRRTLRYLCSACIGLTMVPGSLPAYRGVCELRVHQAIALRCSYMSFQTKAIRAYLPKIGGDLALVAKGHRTIGYAYIIYRPNARICNFC